MSMNRLMLQAGASLDFMLPVGCDAAQSVPFQPNAVMRVNWPNWLYQTYRHPRPSVLGCQLCAAIWLEPPPGTVGYLSMRKKKRKMLHLVRAQNLPIRVACG